MFGNPHRRRRARFRMHRRRHYRRNPSRSVGFAITRPATYLPYVGTAAVAALATGFAPRLWGPNVTATWAYGTQAAVAVVGGTVVGMFVGRAHGLVWLVVGLGIIVADMTARYLLPMTGLAAYPYQSHAALAGIGQQPYYPPTLSELGYYPTLHGDMGAYEPVPGAFAPFDLSYGVASRVGAYWQ